MIEQEGWNFNVLRNIKFNKKTRTTHLERAIDLMTNWGDVTGAKHQDNPIKPKAKQSLSARLKKLKAEVECAILLDDVRRELKKINKLK